MLHHLGGSTLWNDIQHIAGLPFALVRLHGDLLLCGGFGAKGVGLQLVVGQAQLLHDHLLRLFRGTAKQLLLGQLQLLQQPLILQRKAGDDLRLLLFEGGKLCFQSCMRLFQLGALCFQLRIFLLQALIFRTGNGHHFLRVACLHLSVFHKEIIPQGREKSQYFQWFLDILPYLDCAQSCHRTVGFRLFNLQSLHEPAVLLRC